MSWIRHRRRAPLNWGTSAANRHAWEVSVVVSTAKRLVSHGQRCLDHKHA